MPDHFIWLIIVAATDHREPGRQRDQIHRGRGDRCARRVGGAQRVFARAAFFRSGHGNRDPRRQARVRLPSVRAGRLVHDAAFRRDRPGPGNLGPVGRVDGRTNLGRERAGQGHLTMALVFLTDQVMDVSAFSFRFSTPLKRWISVTVPACAAALVEVLNSPAFTKQNIPFCCIK